MKFVEDGGVRKVKMSEYSVDSGRHIGIGSDGRDASIDPSTPDGRRTSSGRGRSRATGNVCHASRLVGIRPRMSWLDELLPWRTKVEKRVANIENCI